MKSNAEKYLVGINKIETKISTLKNLDEVLEFFMKTLKDFFDMELPTIWHFVDQNTLEVLGTKIEGIPKNMLEFEIKRDIKGFRINKNEIANSNQKNLFSKGIVFEYENFFDLFSNQKISMSKIFNKFFHKQNTVIIPISEGNFRFGLITGTIPIDINEYQKISLEIVANKLVNIFKDMQSKTVTDQNINDLKTQNSDLVGLYTLTKNISENLEPDLVLTKAVNTLPKDENVLGAIVSLSNKDGTKLKLSAFTENKYSKIVEKLIGPLTNFSLNLNEPESRKALSARAFLEQNFKYTSNLSEYLYPTLSESLTNTIQKLLKVSAVASFPIISKRKIYGTFSYILRNTDYLSLSPSKKQILQTYVNQIAIALDNSTTHKTLKRAEKKLKKTLKFIEEVRAHEKDMMDILGHELRTPMSLIKNSLALINNEVLESNWDKVKIKKYIDIAYDASKRETRLIETLLSSTKANSKGFQLVFEKVDLKYIINNSVLSFKRTLENKGLALEVKIAEEDFLVYADKVRTQEVIDNFFSNAIKYTYTGKIIIRLSKTSKKTVFVEVIDTGLGIAEEDLAKLGTKFFRSDSTLKGMPNSRFAMIKPSGTGLGLFVAFSLVKVMNGNYQVRTELGVGSNFSFELPVYEGQERLEQLKILDEK